MSDPTAQDSYDQHLKEARAEASDWQGAFNDERRANKLLTHSLTEADKALAAMTEERDSEREDKQTAIELLNERGDKLQAAILRADKLQAEVEEEKRHNQIACQQFDEMQEANRVNGESLILEYRRLTAALEAMTEERDEDHNRWLHWQEKYNEASGDLYRTGHALKAAQARNAELERALESKKTSYAILEQQSSEWVGILERAIQDARRARDCWEDNFTMANGKLAAFKSALLEAEELIDAMDTHLEGRYGSAEALERIKELRALLSDQKLSNDSSGVEGHAGMTSESLCRPPLVVCDRKPSHGSGIITGQSENQASPAIASLPSPDHGKLPSYLKDTSPSDAL